VCLIQCFSEVTHNVFRKHIQLALWIIKCDPTDRVRIDLKDGVCATSAGHGATQSLPRLIKGSRPGTCSCLGGLIAVYGCGHTNERLQLKPLLGVSTGKRHLSRVPSNNFDRDVPVEFCISELVPSMDPVLARLNL